MSATPDSGKRIVAHLWAISNYHWVAALDQHGAYLVIIPCN